jgi:hypothetical protein
MEALHASRLKELSGDDMIEYLLDCVTVFKDLETLTDKNRGDMYKRYLSEVEKKPQEAPKVKQFGFECPFCGSTNLHFEEDLSESICGNCASSEYVLGSYIGFKDEQELNETSYSYKRENHFNEWIAQFQAKERTSVPENVIEQLKTEVKKQRLRSPDDITHKKVRELLKKLGYSKYYEHTPYITTILCGVQPPTMPVELEEKLRLMFLQIQRPFEHHCPKDRKNFLSYSYVLYKFCELLGEDDYLKCFPLLKSKDKLWKQDQIWKKITQELRWEYIPTI